MTTIATDGRTMAGDGLLLSGDTIFGRNMRKVHRLPDGRIIGCVGSSHDAAAFREWIEGGGDKPKLGGSFEALVLGIDGTCLCYDETCISIVEELPTAAGSGRAFALAAMDFGKSPEEAVSYATTRDRNTGGKITVLERTIRSLEAA